MDLTEEEVGMITRFLDVASPARVADLALVFGTRYEEPARIAAGLYHAGLAPYVVMTGGANRLTGANEAQAHRMTLRAHLPAGVRYYARPFVPQDVPREGWHLQEGSRRRVLNEWQAIPRYLRTGDIAEIRAEGGAHV